jgi:O-antigen/teichoic acid export membrane protein
VLWQVAPTIEVFFFWQAVVSAVHTTAARFLLWRLMPSSKIHATFSLRELRAIWRYAAHVSGYSILMVAFSQLDKIILSKVLSLEQFGYYALASAAANAMFYLVSPVTSALLPRFTQLIQLKEWPALREAFRTGSQLVGTAVFPIAGLFALFGAQVLTVWTHQPAVVANATITLGLLAVASALNAAMNIPYALINAAGHPQIIVVQYALSLVLYSPVVFLAATHWHAPGAAVAAIALNSVYLLTTVAFAHHRVFDGGYGEWITADVLLPLTVAFGTTALLRVATPPIGPRWATALYLLVVYGFGAMAAFAVCSKLRNRAAVWLRHHSALVGSESKLT